MAALAIMGRAEAGRIVDGVVTMRQTADQRGIEGATMPGRVMRAIRRRLGLSIYELASLLRYRDVDGLRKMEAEAKPVSGPVQLVMEMLDDGRLNPDHELADERGPG